MSFVDRKKAIDRELRKVLGWAMRKNEIPNVWFKSDISLHEKAKARVRDNYELLERFAVNVKMHQVFVSCFIFELW